MEVTAKDLRFKLSMLFDLLNKGEDITITYRGKSRAKLVRCDTPVRQEKSDALFGLWKDRKEDVDTMVRELRKGRKFDI